MKRLFEGIGEVIAGTLGWLLAVIIVLVVLGVLVTVGTAALGVLVVLVIIGLIVGAVRKVFGLDRKPKVEVVDRKRGR